MLKRKSYPTTSIYPNSNIANVPAGKIGKRTNGDSFPALLGFYYTSINDKIYGLRVINNLITPVLEKHLKNLKKNHEVRISGLDDDEMKEYRSYEWAAINLTYNPNAKEQYISSPKVARLIADETEMYVHREKVRRSSKEMILIYLIIIFEEYLTDILTALFRKKPSILKTSRKSITYEEAFGYSNLTELLNAISVVEVQSEIASDIENFGKYLNDKLKLPLNKRKDWNQFKEYFYRRHIIVHNSGYPDSKYIQKTGYTGPIDWLEVDNKYLSGAFDTIQTYATVIRDFLNNKYGMKKSKTR